MREPDSMLEGMIMGAGVAALVFGVLGIVFFIIRFAASTVVCS